MYRDKGAVKPQQDARSTCCTRQRDDLDLTLIAKWQSPTWIDVQWQALRFLNMTPNNRRSLLTNGDYLDVIWLCLTIL